jgi:hypothetical protein
MWIQDRVRALPIVRFAAEVIAQNLHSNTNILIIDTLSYIDIRNLIIFELQI